MSFLVDSIDCFMISQKIVIMIIHLIATWQKFVSCTWICLKQFSIQVKLSVWF